VVAAVVLMVVLEVPVVLVEEPPAPEPVESFPPEPVTLVVVPVVTFDPTLPKAAISSSSAVAHPPEYTRRAAPANSTAPRRRIA
jgi:hypothetical protein